MPALLAIAEPLATILKEIIEIFNYIVKWTNENSGFLSLVLFLATLVYGWWSGLWNSLNKKAKLKIRFIDKVSFYSFFHIGEKWLDKKSNVEYDLHKTGFAVYMSIANVGNKPTTIDKIYLGYEKNKPKSNWFKKDINWLAQWHPAEEFKMENADGTFIAVNNLRIKYNSTDNKNDDFLDVGTSTVGVAYFEQETAWGNYSPKQLEDESIEIIIKIRDIYHKEYKFRTSLKKLPIEKARKYNQHFGNIENLINGRG